MNVPEQMIVIHMADSYYAMHKRIYWWLTSKRKERHALLKEQRYKDYIIPWCNDISYLSYIHPLIHSNLNQTNIHITFILIIIEIYIYCNWKSTFNSNKGTQIPTDHSVPPKIRRRVTHLNIWIKICPVF